MNKFDEDLQDFNEILKKGEEERQVKNNQEFKNSLFLDTETTGLSDDDEIVQIGIIDYKGKVLLDELIRPDKPISQEATEIHGITNKMVENSPFYTEIHLKILDIIKGKNLLIYNKDFDTRILHQTAYKNGCLSFEFNHKEALCVMSWYSRIYGDYNDYFDSYRWQKLTDAAEQQSIDISDLSAHEAISDCEITRRLVNKLIEKNPIF